MVKNTLNNGTSKARGRRPQTRTPSVRRDVSPAPAVSSNRALGRVKTAAQGTVARSVAPAPGFREASEAVIDLSRPHWQAGGDTEKTWRSSLERFVHPTIGSKAVNEITAKDLLNVLASLWVDRHRTAVLVRQRIRRVLRWCQAQGYVRENVAAGRLDFALPPIRATNTPRRVLPYEEVPDALAAVDSCGAGQATRLCFRFLVLSAATSAEARGARWSEIDMRARRWHVPKGRTPNGGAHRQPLSGPALIVLEAAKTLDDRSGLVFPSPMCRGKPLRSETLMHALRRAGLDERTTVEAFRLSFQNWATGRTDAHPAVIKLALGRLFRNEHGNVTNDRFFARDDLMEQWGAYACGSSERGPARRASRVGANRAGRHSVM